MLERKHNVVIRVTAEELAKIHRVADAQDREISRILRAFINSTYEERFGNEAPPKPKLKNTRKKVA